MFQITRDPSSESLAKITVILAKHCTKLPDDENFVIWNMFGTILNIL